MSDKDKKLLVVGGVILVLAVVFAVRGTGGDKSTPAPVAAKRPAPTRPADDIASEQEQAQPDRGRTRSASDRRRGAGRLDDGDDQVAAEGQDEPQDDSEAQAGPRDRSRRRSAGEGASRRSRRGRVDDESATEEKKKEERKPAAMGASDL